EMTSGLLIEQRIVTDLGMSKAALLHALAPDGVSDPLEMSMSSKTTQLLQQLIEIMFTCVILQASVGPLTTAYLSRLQIMVNLVVSIPFLELSVDRVLMAMFHCALSGRSSPRPPPTCMVLTTRSPLIRVIGPMSISLNLGFVGNTQYGTSFVMVL
ncbi:hypothetical protein FOL47_003632, partial [Perkinsus chesapeaki]